jgi:hypothetical protein
MPETGIGADNPDRVPSFYRIFDACLIFPGLGRHIAQIVAGTGMNLKGSIASMVIRRTGISIDMPPGRSVARIERQWAGLEGPEAVAREPGEKNSDGRMFDRTNQLWRTDTH